MLMMRPNCRSRIDFTTADAQKKTPLMFTSMTFCHSAGGISSNGRLVRFENIEALLINTSTRPNSANTAATIESTDSFFETSTANGSALPPAALFRRQPIPRFEELRSATTATDPAAAN